MIAPGSPPLHALTEDNPAWGPLAEESSNLRQGSYSRMVSRTPSPGERERVLEAAGGSPISPAPGGSGQWAASGSRSVRAKSSSASSAAAITSGSSWCPRSRTSGRPGGVCQWYVTEVIMMVLSAG
ncbi:hypothetical protein SUDANB15_04228 [Streptomyces sp. enrichment culture]